MDVAGASSVVRFSLLGFLGADGLGAFRSLACSGCGEIGCEGISAFGEHGLSRGEILLGG
jgi:hypothetical protein